MSSHPIFLKDEFSLMACNSKIVFSVEVQTRGDLNILVLEKKEGDKFNFLEIFKDIVNFIK